MKKYLFLAFIAFVLCGCSESSGILEDKTDETRKDDNKDDNVEVPAEETGTWVTSHFITEYLVASEIAVENKNGTLCLKVLGDEYYTHYPSDISKEALELANMYNDNSYTGGIHPGAHPALAYPLDKITICCDKDFDAEHPAGESLDDIAQLGFCSFYPFVENGYNYFPMPDDWWYNDRVRYTMPFASVNAEVTKLLWAYFLTSKISPSYVAKIDFVSQPETPGEYAFALEMTTNGETLKTEFTHTFE